MNPHQHSDASCPGLFKYKFNKMKNSVAQSCWPHRQGSVATSGEWWPYWVAQMENIAITGGSSRGQHGYNLSSHNQFPLIYGANCIFLEPSIQDVFKPSSRRLWIFLWFGDVGDGHRGLLCHPGGWRPRKLGFPSRPHSVNGTPPNVTLSFTTSTSFAEQCYQPMNEWREPSSHLQKPS